MRVRFVVLIGGLNCYYCCCCCRSRVFCLLRSVIVRNGKETVGNWNGL